MAKKPLNIGMIGYGFMGRTHSNAYRKVNNFFDLEYQPVLKAACARNQPMICGTSSADMADASLSPRSIIRNVCVYMYEEQP